MLFRYIWRRRCSFVSEPILGKANGVSCFSKKQLVLRSSAACDDAVPQGNYLMVCVCRSTPTPFVVDDFFFPPLN